jgi:hypothetical protein
MFPGDQDTVVLNRTYCRATDMTESTTFLDQLECRFADVSTGCDVLALGTGHPVETDITLSFHQKNTIASLWVRGA